MATLTVNVSTGISSITAHLKTASYEYGQVTFSDSHTWTTTQAQGRIIFDSWSFSSGYTSPAVATVTSGTSGTWNLEDDNTAWYYGSERTVKITGTQSSGGYTYALVLYGNNGTWSDSSTYKTYSKQTTATTCTFTLSDYPTPTRSGYEFAGWYTEAEGGTKKTSVTAVLGSQTVSVYAHWNYINTFSLILYGNGGKWGTNTYITDSGTSTSSTYTFPLSGYTLPTRSGYTFAGWYTASEGGDQKTSITVTTAGGSVYAHWTPDSYSYTITYNPNGGSGSAITDTVEGSGSSFNTYLRDSTFTKAYNTQSGWTDGTNTYGLGWLITISSNISLNATWTHDETSKFYWLGTDSADWNSTTGITQGADVTNLTATSWKSIGTKIRALQALLGDTQSTFTTSMTRGSVFKASYYNEVVNALNAIKNNHSLSVSVPSSTTKGNRLFYYLFNGSASIKQCLNNIIQWYNTR